MIFQYILDGHTPVAEPDILRWAQWLETARRHVALWERADEKVSTIFLGLDHGSGEGPPLLFETMVFGGPHDGEQERYSTWEEAEAGHATMVRKVQTRRRR